MKIAQLLTISIVTIITLWTVYFWIDRWKGMASPLNEAFESDINIKIAQQLINANEPAPTDEEAVAAHQTLLRYIRNDFNKGIKFILDFRDRFFGPSAPIRSDLDVRTLMDDYSSPLQRQ
jgi:hypothetical protein